ncbi:MAG: hypothetical protein LN569_00065 [Rickettsia endosymbiont of Labidopullus appendiculatus]|nr:hypothetical protein [Rickettsia endosymbiont of Labidopullus appendiculatus]
MGQRQDITEQVPQEVTNISAFEKEFKLAKETQVNNSVEVEKSTGIGVSDNVKEMVLSKQIIHKAIKLVEEGGKRKLDYSQQNKIIEKLFDKLSKLDIDYLKTEEQAIAKTIAKNIKKDASKSLFSNKITVSDKILTKYADDIEKSDGAKSDKIAVEVIVAHGSKSNEFAAKELKRGNMEISEKLVDHQVTNIPIKERISKLLATNEAANRWGVFNETVGLKNVIDKQLATLKKISPKEFDETASPKSDIAKITTKKQEQKQKLFPEIDLKEMGLKDITIKHTIKYIIMDADDKRVQKITPVRNKAKAIENQR